MFVVRCSLFVTSTSSAHRSASVCSLGFVICDLVYNAETLSITFQKYETG